MKKLSELQQQWIDALCQTDKVSADFYQQFEHAKIDPSLGVQVYQDSLQAALLTHLQDTFAICQQLVGEEFWIACMQRYILETPSRKASIADYGDTVPDFLMKFEHTQSLPYLADVARLDWAWHRCFYAENAGNFDAAAFATQAPEVMLASQLVLNPSLQIISSTYPIYSIWQSNYNNDGKKLSLTHGGENVVVWRQGLATRMSRLSEVQLQWLRAITEKQHWQQVCESLTAAGEADAITDLLMMSVENQWISSFTSEES